MNAIIIASSGHSEGFWSRIWASDECLQFFETGEAVLPGSEHRFAPPVGRVLVNLNELEAALEEMLANTRSETEVQLPHNLPPYLAFMLRAVEQLDLGRNTKLRKKVIVAWLHDNWPRDLGKRTDRKLESMATFLRRPEDEKGGQDKKQ